MNEKLISINPSTNEIIWSVDSSTSEEINKACLKSTKTQSVWKKVSLEEKQKIILNFAHLVKENIDEAATIISEENGKPFWEAKMEVNSLVNKVQVVFDAYEERAKPKIKQMKNGKTSVTRYFPHGVLAVLGPYNFPMSMPNSHIMPAIYAGNTVIFKPSEKTPKSAWYYKMLWSKAGLPDGVIEIINGDYTVGESLINSNSINGVLFIGSRKAGKQIEAKMSKKDKICALEMGGNSPLIIWDYKDIRSAINISIQSAFISSGQRCSAARRLIINNDIYDEFILALKKAVENIVVGNPFDDVFMGPMIDHIIVTKFLNDYNSLIDKGAQIIVPSGIISELGSNFVKPSLLDVTNIEIEDIEIFGPLLQISRAYSLKEAVTIANNTKYGLAAGIVTTSRDNYEYFLENIKSGIVNWNQSLTGSTTIAPFGGIKGSGNYRPAGYLSVDYCIYACASIENQEAELLEKLSPGLKF